jgi:hypothetical protein
MPLPGFVVDIPRQPVPRNITVPLPKQAAVRSDPGGGCFVSQSCVIWPFWCFCTRYCPDPATGEPRPVESFSC